MVYLTLLMSLGYRAEQGRQSLCPQRAFNLELRGLIKNTNRGKRGILLIINVTHLRRASAFLQGTATREHGTWALQIAAMRVSGATEGPDREEHLRKLHV